MYRKAYNRTIALADKAIKHVRKSGGKCNRFIEPVIFKASQLILVPRILLDNQKIARSWKFTSKEVGVLSDTQESRVIVLGNTV